MKHISSSQAIMPYE